MRYVIMGTSRYGTEEVDEADDRKEADYMLREYRLAFGPEWRLWARRMRESEVE